MAWFKVDDGLHSHPKVIDLELEALGLWVAAGSWCADYLTDGLISSGQIRRLGGTDELAEELVRAELWSREGKRYRFNDWTDYQPTKSAVESEREAARRRMQELRSGRGSKPKGSGSVRPNSARTSPARSPEVPDPDPSRTSKEVSASDDADVAASFDAWWTHYPKKVDKGQARKAFKAALQKTTLEELTQGAKHYATTVQGQERRYIKNPSTWLNAESWANDTTHTPPPKSYIWDQ